MDNFGISSSQSYTSSSSHAVSDRFGSYDEELAPFILADLRDSESCNVDQFLAVFLERCRATDPPTDPTTSRIPQSVGSSQNHSPPSDTTVTERSTGNSETTTNLTSLPPDPEGPVRFPPASHELLDPCLQQILPICGDSEIRDFIAEYQASYKEVPRYNPFVKLANRGLNCVKSFKFPGLREASALDVLFHTNDKKGVDGQGDISRFPDIVVVSLASAKRAHSNFTENRETCVQDHDSESRHQFKWADVLISAEMKWYRPTLNFEQPSTYTDTALKCSIEPIPTCDEDPGFAPLMLKHSTPIIRAVSTSSPSSNPATPHSACTSAGPRTETTSTKSVTFNFQKRRAEEDPEHDRSGAPASRKRRVDKSNNNIKDHMIKGLKQSGIRGAEMLHCSLGRRQAFGMIIIDAIVWIWWFDRQGAIQSTGINFIKDLPRFLIFLVCIQRFTITDWGFDEKLDPSSVLRHSSHKSPSSSPVELEVDGNNGKFKVNFNSDMPAFLHQVFCLKGKSTRVFEVTSDLDNKLPLVAKLYWPNQNRQHEAEIIRRAREDSDLLNYLPDVFGWHDIDSIGTRRIREELGIDANSPRPPRLLRMLVSEKLSRIIERTGNDLVFAWVQCIRCHYRVWEKHIRHLDISLGNLMIRHRIIEGKDTYFGVVNDWDLGDTDEFRTESRKDLTKTILFTSLDLLKPRPSNEQIVQRYFHDLESFLWVLFWVVLTVQDKRIVPTEKMRPWQTGVIPAGTRARKDFVFTPLEYRPCREWKHQWAMVYKLATWLRSLMMGEEGIPNENEFSDEGEISNESETFNRNEFSEEEAEERKERLRGLLEIVKSKYGDQTPSSPRIEGL
ncbi:unnamed protein product [Rhizoctonia solani]|uniref:Fungal-type protein kinase domain-containing protein n=1 Tax=Rhizoctonia solani TaxID=456999 RepID=A0A8H2WJC0_9AGAM|nr:unnamed protein product [Rhizoctonia solani]